MQATLIPNVLRQSNICFPFVIKLTKNEFEIQINIKCKVKVNKHDEGEKASPLNKTKQGIGFDCSLRCFKAVKNLAAPALGSIVLLLML